MASKRRLRDLSKARSDIARCWSLELCVYFGTNDVRLRVAVKKGGDCLNSCLHGLSSSPQACNAILVDPARSSLHFVSSLFPVLVQILISPASTQPKQPRWREDLATTSEAYVKARLSPSHPPSSHTHARRTTIRPPWTRCSKRRSTTSSRTTTQPMRATKSTARWATPASANSRAWWARTILGQTTPKSSPTAESSGGVSTRKRPATLTPA